jgi:hypothetical protein
MQVNASSLLAPLRSFPTMYTLFVLIRAACIVNAVLSPRRLDLTIALGALQVPSHTRVSAYGDRRPPVVASSVTPHSRPAERVHTQTLPTSPGCMCLSVRVCPSLP